MATPKSIYLPAVRALMGDWVYYVATMKMADVAQRVNFADEIHKSKALKELLQRELDESKHAASIRDYLIRDKQRFFNSMVVGVYGGAPEWHEVRVRATGQIANALDSLDHQGLLGFLELSGNERLFAIDGQHRVHGIKQAIKSKSKLANEEVSILFVSHRTDGKGLERTRRLFTRLNRFSKPVRKEEIIALDEDDVIAILTRRLVDEYKPLDEKIAVSKTKAIPTSDKTSFTTIGTLYDLLDNVFSYKQENWSDYKRVRPSDAIIAEYEVDAKSLIEAVGENFPAVGELLSSSADDSVAGKYRHKKGGHLLFRPMGILIFAKTLSAILSNDGNLRQTIKNFGKLPMEISQQPWAGLIWDNANNRMITAPENQKAAIKMVYRKLGGDLADFDTTEEELQNELAGLLNRKPSDINMDRLFQ